MEAGKYRAFQGRLNSRSEPRTKLVAKTPNPQVLARVSLLASHERLREKRLCLAGVQAIKSRFFAPINRKYLYILSYPVFLYYAETPKVPPRVFGPLGPKTLRGQLVLVIFFFNNYNNYKETGAVYEVRIYASQSTYYYIQQKLQYTTYRKKKASGATLGYKDRYCRE